MSNEELKKVGLKATTPRIKILGALERSEQRHMSAEQMYQALRDAGEDVGLATIYRVLTQFESAGLVTKHFFEGTHGVFELNEGDHHDHLVCINCGSVEEFVDDLIEKRQAEIAKTHHFQMTDHNLNIYGVCQNCR